MPEDGAVWLATRRQAQPVVTRARLPEGTQAGEPCSTRTDQDDPGIWAQLLSEVGRS